jgi:hypothetical protein
MRNNFEKCGCVIRVDRVVFTSGLALPMALDGLSGFTTVRDHALRNIGQSRFGQPYGRVREMIDTVTRTRLFINYNPRFRQLPGLRVTVVPDDASGMQRPELEEILSAFAPYEFPEGGLRVVEVASDFTRRGMNAAFVRRHVRFGKSRMRPNVRFPKAAWFGVAGSDHFLRCYWKPSVLAFRTEAQFNRGSLIKHGVHTALDIARLPPVLLKQLGFHRIDWDRLSANVRRHPRYADVILRKAREQETCLNQLLRFLRNVGISNPVRFLVPLAINLEIEQAVQKWSQQWESGHSYPAGNRKRKSAYGRTRNANDLRYVVTV